MQSLSPQYFEQMYAMASRGNVSGLNNARSRGLNIDSVNSNGDTGLCAAARRRDRTAFRSFLQAGANSHHPCTWEVDGYQSFMQSATRTPQTNWDTAIWGAKAGQGMSWTTMGLIGAGVVAAGTGVALAVGGGYKGGVAQGVR